MSQINAQCLYSKDHEWALVEGDIAVVGITDHAQSELGDIVFVELPEIGDTLEMGDSFGSVEAVKTVADLYAPVSGEIVAINEELADNAEMINNSPYAEGWIIKIKLSNPEELKELMDAEGYKQFIN